MNAAPSAIFATSANPATSSAPCTSATPWLCPSSHSSPAFSGPSPAGGSPKPRSGPCSCSCRSSQPSPFSPASCGSISTKPSTPTATKPQSSHFGFQREKRRPKRSSTSLRQRWAAGEFAQGGVTNILEVGDADLAGVEAVAGEAAQEGEEGHALAERGILFGVFPEGDQIQDFFLLFRGAFQENFAVAVGAEVVQPEKSAAEAQLIFFIFAGEQINKFRGAGFDRAARFFVLGNNRVAERDERSVLRPREEFQSVLPCRSRGLLFVHHLVDVLGGSRWNHLQHRTARRSKGESAEDVAAAYGFVGHGLLSERKEKELNAEAQRAQRCCAPRRDGGIKPSLKTDRRAMWGNILEVAFLGFVEQIVGGAPGERHDRQRWIFVRISHQRRAIGEKQIFHVVRLAVSVEHGGFRVGAHSRGAYFVNDFPAFLNSIRIRAVNRGLGLVLAAHGLHDAAKRFLHVLGLAQLVFRPLEMETQHGNAPLVDDIGNDLATAGETDGGAVMLASALLQLGAIAFLLATQSIEHADAGHVESAAELDVVAARKIVLAVELPPRHVHVHSADAVVVVRGHL